MSYASDVKSYTTRVRACAVANVVNHLINIGDKHNGRVPRDYYERIIKCLEEIGVEISLDALYKRVQREELNRLKTLKHHVILHQYQKW